MKRSSSLFFGRWLGIFATIAVANGSGAGLVDEIEDVWSGGSGHGRARRQKVQPA